jgi:hypothetical protein
MRLVTLLILLLLIPSLSFATPIGIYQQGTITRMHLGECTSGNHEVLSMLGGTGPQLRSSTCPEYTLVGDKVVYVIVAKKSDELAPLAEKIDFRLRNNELLIRIDDSRRELRFTVKEMTLRSEWEQAQKRE